MVVETFYKAYSEEDRNRRIEFLGALHPYHGFAKIIAVTSDGLVTTWCGNDVEKVLKAGVVTPQVVEAQFQGLLSILFINGIQHRDIKKHNMLWHPTKGAHLIDFGTAIWMTEPNICPENRWPDEEFMKLSDVEQLKFTMKLLKGEL